MVGVLSRERTHPAPAMDATARTATSIREPVMGRHGNCMPNEAIGAMITVLGGWAKVWRVPA